MYIQVYDVCLSFYSFNHCFWLNLNIPLRLLHWLLPRTFSLLRHIIFVLLLLVQAQELREGLLEGGVGALAFHGQALHAHDLVD